MLQSEVFNMDCIEGMKQFKDKFFDLAIVDPPYGIDYVNEAAKKSGQILGINRVKRNTYKPGDWDKEPPSAEYFDELFRVSKNQIIWGGNYFLNHLGATRCVIVWDKVNHATHFADFELAWTSFPTSSRKFNFTWNGMMQGTISNGLKVNGKKELNEKRIHPNQKPVALYYWLLKNYAIPGDKILDTHLGSGSSRIAAYKMGFDFVGFELDPDYFAQARSRFMDETSSPLFDQPKPLKSQYLF